MIKEHYFDSPSTSTEIPTITPPCLCGEAVLSVEQQGSPDQNKEVVTDYLQETLVKTRLNQFLY